MAILNESKQDLNHLFGLPKQGQLLVGGDEWFEAEEALCYTVGKFQVTVGFRNEISRYACFAKDRRDDQSFDDQDVDVCLALLNPDSSWSLCDAHSGAADSEEKSSQASDSSWIILQYQTTARDSNGNEIPIVTSHRKFKPYVIAYTTVDNGRGRKETLEELALKMNSATTPEAKLDAVIEVLNALLAGRES